MTKTKETPNLHSNPDAQVWAKEFSKHFTEPDTATMVGWFANAMMAMYDHKTKTVTEKGNEMNKYDVKRLALVLATQAEIEGMKTANNQHEQDQPYTDKDFQAKAEELRDVAYKHVALLFL